MHNNDPYTTKFEGNDVTVYPHRVRSDRNSDYKPVTTGGYIIGYVKKHPTRQYSAYDMNYNHVATVEKQGRAAELLAMRDDALQQYRVAAREGAFGDAAQEAERTRVETLIEQQAHDGEDTGPTDEEYLQGSEPVCPCGRGCDYNVAEDACSNECRCTDTVREDNERANEAAQQRYLNTYLVDEAGEPQTCQEPAVQYGGFPPICGAPLRADGTCPAERAHRSIIARSDRDSAVRRAHLEITKAMAEQRSLEGRNHSGLYYRLQLILEDLERFPKAAEQQD